MLDPVNGEKTVLFKNLQTFLLSAYQLHPNKAMHRLAKVQMPCLVTSVCPCVFCTTHQWDLWTSNFTSYFLLSF